MKRFKDKTVIITGAGSGIGRATALRFANEGATVVLIGRTKESLEATADLLPQDHSFIHADNHLTVTCDISDRSQVSAMVEYVLNKFKHIDVVVNNAGKSVQGKITELSDEDWKASIDVNLNGTFYVCQAVMPALIESKGSIINVSSLSSMSGDWRMRAYSSVRAGVTNLTRALALDHGPDGVRVNAVSPGATQTDIADTNRVETGLESDFLKHCPLGRIGSPEDIAAAITFLASEDANMITGINLPVDGGVSASNHYS